MRRHRFRFSLGRGSPVHAIGDQLAAVAGNFLLGVVVARNSSLEEFASFSLFYAFVVLLNFLHVPLINDPLVLRVASGRNTALSKMLVATVQIFLPISIIGLSVLVVTDTLGMGDALFLMLPAAVLSSLYWSARSALHSAGNHAGAFVASGLGTLCMLSALAVLVRCEVEPVSAAVISMATGALAGLGCAACCNTGSSAGPVLAAKAAPRPAAGLLVAGFAWLAGNASMLFLASLGRPDDIAGLRSVLTLLLPINQVLVGLSAFLLPRFARLHQSDNPIEMKRLMAGLSVGCIGLAVLFFLLVYPISGYLLELIYGDDYRRFDSWMRLGAAALPLCWGLITLCRARLRGTGNLNGLLLVNSIGLLVGLPLSLACLMLLGDYAVMISFVVIQVAMLSAYLLMGSAQRAR